MRPRSPRKGPDGKALPPTVADLLPGARRKKFLALLAERNPPGVAAREFGLTGSQIRSVRRRDPEFDRQCAEAWGEGENLYEERLSKLAETRAETSDRILEVELATHGGSKYAHLRRDRVRVEGTVEHMLVIDPSKIRSLPDADLVAFRDLMAKLVGEDAEIVEATEVLELPPGDAATG